MCARLLDTLGRMDLDRRLLMKEKIEVLLERRDPAQNDKLPQAALKSMKQERRRAIVL